MAILITTTGTIPTVTLKDLAGRKLVHPSANINLANEFPEWRIRQSRSLQAAINVGTVTVKDEHDTPITNPSADMDPILEIEKNIAQFNADRLQGVDVDVAGLADRQVLRYFVGSGKFQPDDDRQPRGVQYVLDATDITNGYVTLPSIPSDLSQGMLYVGGGPNLFLGTAFTITFDGKLVWTGYSLGGILEVGDEMTVVYLD